MILDASKYPRLPRCSSPTCTVSDVRVTLVRIRFTEIFAADHTMGLITILRNVLGMPTSWDHSHDPQPREYMRPSVEIYGPAGLRSFVRTNFNLTHTRSARHYCVHELLHLREIPSAACNPHDLMHPNEELGKDIFPDEHGFWTDICEEFVQRSGRVTVDAGPIEHRGTHFVDGSVAHAEPS